MNPRRTSAAVAAGATLVLLAGIAVLALRGADTTTTYDEQAALDGFRAGSSPTPGPSPTAVASPSTAPSAAAGPTSAASSTAPSPAAGVRASAAASAPAVAGASPVADEVEPGVYRYDTEGFEEVDALGGARHDYPDSSTITYSRAGCGTEERWRPLEERVGVTQTCAGAEGEEVRSTYQQREFFGQSQSETYTCAPGSLVLPDDPRPGRTWRGSCRSDDSTFTLDGRVVALEELVVGGTRVPVVRVAISGTLTGSTRGRSNREVWLARANGLLVQAVADTDTDADTAGGTVRYRESYRLRLQSLTPSR